MKSKSLIAALALVLPMSGCSVLFPDPPSNICKEENKPLSKEELIYRALDHFYDDPHHQKPVNDRVKSLAYYKAPPALTHFANYKVRYLNISPTASRREVITSYYNKFPNCCLLYDPPVHFQTSSFEPRDVRGPRWNEDTSLVYTYPWTYDFILFPKMTLKNSFKEQRQYLKQRVGAKIGEVAHPKKPPNPLPIIYRGMSACGIITLTSRENWIISY